MTTDVLYCQRHPNVETGLRCGRCETPICPRCAVFTDVGARCPDCAPRRKLPQMEVGPLFVLRAVGAAVVAGTVTGTLWGLIIPDAVGFFALAIGAGIGYAVGESVSVATNRKVGTLLQVIAGVGVALAYLVHNAVGTDILPGDEFWELLAVLLGIVIAVGRLRF